MESAAGLKIKIPDFEFEAYVKESEFDQDKQRKNLRLEVLGRQDGLENIPGSSTTGAEMTATEFQVVNVCQEKLDKVAKTTSYALSYLDDSLEKLYMKIGEPNFQRISQDGNFKIKELKQIAKNQLIDARKDERQQYGYLAYFKRSNGITRAAEYPESKILGYGLLIFIVVVETIINSYFFARASDFGLLGGAMQAAMVSIVNVLWSFVMAVIAYRGLHYRSAFRKMAAIIGVMIHICAAIAINLAVAHYRDLIAIDPATAMSLTLEKLRQAPIELATLDAALLFIIGCVISLISVWKGYTFDDRYPGYGAQDRKHQKSVRAYRSTRDSVIENSSETLSDSFIRVDELINEQKKRVAHANSVLSSMKTINGRFKSTQSAINDVLRSLLIIYRQENRAIRIEPEPKYFTQYFPTVEHSYALPPITTHESKLSTLNDSIEIWQSKANDVKEELQLAIDALREEMQLLVLDAKSAAMEEIQEDESDLSKLSGSYVLEKSPSAETNK